MQYFLDISLLVVIALTVGVYWRRGLIRSLMGAAKTVLAIILTYTFGDTVSQWLYTTFLQPAMQDYVHTRLEEAVASGELSSGMASLVDETPVWLQQLLDLFDVDLVALFQDISVTNFGEIEALVIRIVQPVAEFLSAIVGYAVVFLVSSLCLSLVVLIMGKVADLPIIKTCDRTLGFILGLACAVVYSSIYVLLLYVLLGWIEIQYSTVPFSAGFDASFLFRQAYEWNLFRLLFGF